MRDNLNINSLRNKFEGLRYAINQNLDIILPLETKLDNLFDTAQFIVKDCGTLYRLDRVSNGGVLFLYVPEDIPSKIWKVKSDCNIKYICVKINLKKRKWFINNPCDPHISLISTHLECLNRITNKYRKSYQYFLFLGDFNASTNEKCMEDFFNLNSLLV